MQQRSPFRSHSLPCPPLAHAHAHSRLRPLSPTPPLIHAHSHPRPPSPSLTHVHGLPACGQLARGNPPVTPEDFGPHVTKLEVPRNLPYTIRAATEFFVAARTPGVFYGNSFSTFSRGVSLMRQVCVARRQVCVARRQVCVARRQVCVARRQVCVTRRQVCVARRREQRANDRSVLRILVADPCCRSLVKIPERGSLNLDP